MALSKRSSYSLPFEIVEDILFRTPIESLVRFQSVCKQWYAFLNDKRFIYKHFDLSQKYFIRHTNKSIQVFNLETQALSSLQGPSNISVMIHCDGLLLCKFFFHKSFSIKLAVWNPVLRQIKWIEPSNSYRWNEVIGFGYDNVSRDNYKILNFLPSAFQLDVEIYELKSKLWRSVDATDINWLVHSSLRVGLSMNGNMYWVAHSVNSEIFILSFDFSKETFKHICFVPFKAERFERGHTIILSAFQGDKISILHQYNHVKIEVWVTNQVTDEVVSWRKYFNVTRLNLPYPCPSCSPVYFINKSNSIVLWCDEAPLDNRVPTNINLYEMRDGEIKKLMLVEPHRLSLGVTSSACYVYVPSRVPVLE